MIKGVTRMTLNKEEIYEFIFSKMLGYDKYPYAVIRDSYDGDEEKYLIDMKKYHNI